jgi:DNA-binding phage protein
LEIRSAVKNRMKEKGVKVPDLARVTGYTSRHIYDLLSGHARWNETTLSKIFSALELEFHVRPVGQKLTGTDGQ